MQKPISRILVVLLAVSMLISVFPMNAFAFNTNYSDSNGGSDYYNVISKRDWDIAPGVKETEVVLNNDAGTRRQVLHTAVVDVTNPYVKVIAGYKGMWPKAGNYGVQSTSTQALEAERLGYGNVVIATNTTLSWYDDAYYAANPHLIGEPLGYTILDGEYYECSRGKTYATKTCIVINYDKRPLDGAERPADMPKVWVRSTSDPLTGWEEQVIPVTFDFLVKPDANGNPVNLYKEDHGSGIASRTFVGVKADGTLVLSVSDGEQAPFSTGFTTYEMADYMIKMGCVVAANCDGGGSTTFCSQRPGEDLKVNCNLSDGGERPTTSTILVISTAPADGEFARATVTSDYDYYTPGSSVKFNVLGTDAVGTKVDIPAEVEWRIAEDGMGTIENGTFKSNGTEGTATVQIVYNGDVVGEKTITIVTPDKLFFSQPIVTIPFGKTAKVPIKASANINGVDFEIGLGENDIIFTTDNEALGDFDGLNFIAVDESNAPDDITSTVTATLNMGSNPSTTVQLNLGKASDVLWDFEGGEADVDIWNVINNRKNAAHWDYYMNLSLADKTNGQVHDGEYSMRLETNGLSSKDSNAKQYAWIRLGVDGEAIVLENARRIGFWLYVPEDNLQCMVQGHYMIDTNNDGVFDTENFTSMMEQEDVYSSIDESGWHYLSIDVSAFNKIALKCATKYDKDPSDGMTGEKGEFFLAIIFHKATNNLLWSNNGSINGKFTYYIDNFTVDYSDAVDDRENPVFDKIYLDGTTALVKRNVITTNSNILNLSAAVADQTIIKDANKNDVTLHNVSGLNASTAKVYIDGVEVKSVFENGVMSANGIKVADGYHRVKFEISDNAGNKSVVIRVIKVESGEEKSTLQLVPADPTLDRIYFGSIYWMNLEATNIETIQSVSTVIDLNNVNHWQLDHMELAEGFTATYTIKEETNTATITITRTGDNIQTGKAVIAKLPVRIVYFDTDIKVPGYTAETYWTSYQFWPQDMKMDVDMGLINFADGTTGTFSNEEFHVDTEMFTDRPYMAQIDYEYLNSHGTTHVHTPVALADKAANCTENGYTGRTFCNVCNSVVEWGETVNATGHTYEVVGNKLACDCGREFTGTGLQLIGGKGYYTTAGVLTGGWVSIEDEWYYFDTTTFASVPTYYNGYVTYEFEVDGKLISGQWYKSFAGIRYYEGPSYLRGGKSVMTWYEIDGKNYCFDKQGYVATGTRWVDDQNDTTETYTWHHFDENGAHIERWNYTGLAEWNGNYYYVKDGVSQTRMHFINGSYYYFHWTDYRAAIKDQRFNCVYNNGLLPAGSYYFGSDGKMLDKTVYSVNGTLYYFILGNEAQGPGSVVYNGVECVIDNNGKVLYTGSFKDSDGYVNTYENGTLINKVRTGIFEENGKLYYFENNVKVQKGLVKDDNGDYYYFGSNYYAVTNGTFYFPTEKLNGLYPEGGNFKVDADGKVIMPEVKNGIIEENGKLYYYENNAKIAKGLVKDANGDYYFFGRNYYAVTNGTFYFTDDKMNGLFPTGGNFKVDADGKVIIPEIKNGIVEENGKLYYYENNVRIAKGLVKDANGDYYYFGRNYYAVTNGTFYFPDDKMNGLLPAGGNFKVDADGKVIIG